MTIKFTGEIIIRPTVAGRSTPATEVQGELWDNQTVFYKLWEEVGDEELKRWLSSEGFELVETAKIESK